MASPLTARPELAALLASHGLAGAFEERIEHAGFSGAHITRLRRRDGASFVLKRMSIERDWIMRATADISSREAAFARTPPPLPDAVATPALDAARDGDEHALLMHDITADLLPQREVAGIAAIIDAVARLHASPLPAANTLPWCDLGKRLSLLTPAGALIARGYGAPVAQDLERGWALFDRHASKGAIALVHALFDDVSPLVSALRPLPPSLLHGDLKFDNMGVAPDGRLWLFDWAMTLIAPAAVDLGWFLAINSRRMALSLDDVMALYDRTPGTPQTDVGRHRAMTVLCGLLLRGWRKAIDAEEGEPAELRWWCAQAEAAARYL